MSPSPTASIFTTCAPQSASMRVHHGPATVEVKSATNRPSSGRGAMVVPPASGRFAFQHGDDAGAVHRWCAEHFSIGARPLEVEVILHLPSEADRAEDLDALMGGGDISIAGIGFRHGDGLARKPRFLRQRPGGMKHRGSGAFAAHEHVGKRMLTELILADLPTQHAPLFRLSSPPHT